MIASWRGLAVTAAIAVALAIAVAVDVGRTPAVTDRAIAPGFDPDRVTELIWERAGAPPLRVVRAGAGWEIDPGSPRAPAGASTADGAVGADGTPAAPRVPVDPSAIGDVLAALRGARWHRLGEPAPVHATLVVIAGAGRRVLGIGEPIAGTEQAWIVVEGRGAVVDRWVARALDRDRLALRIKAPLAGVRRAGAISLEGSVRGEPVALHIEGAPRQLAGPARLVIAAELAGALERALGDVAIVRVPDEPVAAHGLAITIADDGSPPGARSAVRVVLGGGCAGAPGLVALSGTPGDGCVEPAAVAAVEGAIARLRQPPAAIVERRPVPFEPVRVVLADRVALDLPTLRAGGAPADPARVAELVAALSAPAEVAGAPVMPAAHQVIVTGRDGLAVTLDLFAERVVARHGEPVALRPAPGAWDLLVRPSRELRDAAPWVEEPTMVTAVRIDDVRYERGAVIGEWTRQPAGAATARVPASAPDARMLDALVAVLAAPRSLGGVTEPVSIVHRVTLTITPPAGAPTERALGIGAPRAAGCPARVERDTLMLPAIVCAQVAALAR
jgi:hypothetical protein